MVIVLFSKKSGYGLIMLKHVVLHTIRHLLFS